ncbi:MAG: phosphate ABC transporter, permease protein PstA, partial [Candidatus Dadabacteria bacterium]
MTAAAFHATAPTIASRRSERLAVGLLGIVTALLILPLLAIVGLLAWLGAPALSWEFLVTGPTAGMTAGGIFPAIVGTMWLIGVSLAVAAPVGILAG